MARILKLDAGTILRDPVHNSLPPVAARARAVWGVAFWGVAFLPIARLLAAKKRLAVHPDPRTTVSPELCKGYLAPMTSRIAKLHHLITSKRSDTA